MVTDLHVHPSPWKNGPGAFSSFARAALRKGIDLLGFAEHGPPVVDDPRFRGLDEPEIGEYVHRIQALKTELRGVLQIFCGLELDYHPDFLRRYERFREDFPLDYFLVSVHVIDDWYIDDRESLAKSIHRHRSEEELYRLYFDRLSEAVRTGLFDGIAHLDYYRRSLPHPTGEPPAFARDIFDEFCENSSRKRLPVEINTRGLRLENVREVHPSRTLLRSLVRAGTHFFLGSDAHEEGDVGAGIREATGMLSAAGLGSVIYFKRHQVLNAPF